jgi:hypothetical protein
MANIETSQEAMLRMSEELMLKEKELLKNYKDMESFLKDIENKGWKDEVHESFTKVASLYKEAFLPLGKAMHRYNEIKAKELGILKKYLSIKPSVSGVIN